MNWKNWKNNSMYKICQLSASQYRENVLHVSTEVLDPTHTQVWCIPSEMVCFDSSPGRKFTREDQANSSLNFPWRDGGFFGVYSQSVPFIRMLVNYLVEKKNNALEASKVAMRSRRCHWRRSSRLPLPCWRYWYQDVPASESALIRLSLQMRSKMSLTKEFKIAIVLLEIPVSGAASPFHQNFIEFHHSWCMMHDASKTQSSHFFTFSNGAIDSSDLASVN